MSHPEKSLTTRMGAAWDAILHNLNIQDVQDILTDLNGKLAHARYTLKCDVPLLNVDLNQDSNRSSPPYTRATVFRYAQSGYGKKILHERIIYHDSSPARLQELLTGILDAIVSNTAPDQQSAIREIVTDAQDNVHSTSVLTRVTQALQDKGSKAVDKAYDL